MTKMFHWPVVPELNLREDVDYRFDQLSQKLAQGQPLTTDEYWDLDYIKEGTERLLATIREMFVESARLERSSEGDQS